MRNRRYKSITFLLALLLAASSWVSLPGRAEAQMRCAGAPPMSAPCARAELPAAGLTEKQVYGALMSCCRSMRDCPMWHSSRGVRASQHAPAATRSALSARRCLVFLRVPAAAPSAPGTQRSRWLLGASPALAPPVAASAALVTSRTVRVVHWAYSPALSPHAAPALHGLRAPPAV